MIERTPVYLVGLDVGSTTVKAVVIDEASDAILWSDYQRHETKQPEKVLEFLDRIRADLGISDAQIRMYITGSGGSTLAPFLGAKFVQEVNAVSLAVEKLYPETGSVVELGGQDAKIIIFKEDPETGRKKKIPSMNDKCAGGTGAVIDKINAKLRIPAEELSSLGYNGVKLHPVAGKCGVFAETDINGLQKQGVPPDELMASLFESIVQQNLSVLTRGHTLRPDVLLLGGPNTFIRGMVECWRANIPPIWAERDISLPEGVDPASLIKVPENAQYFAAIGAVEFGRENAEEIPIFPGTHALEEFITRGRHELKKQKGSLPLVTSTEELEAFKSAYRIPPFTPTRLEKGSTFRAFLGIDGGSTSTKGVLIDEDRRVAFKAYQLSKGNPIEDTMQIVGALHEMVRSQGATLDILGVGTTGYAKDVLKNTIGGDVALVETVAHTQAALHFYDNVDVICDVGGQDIKIIVLKDGRVVDFKLNTQCSAGNGYFLQSTAEGFGFDVKDFADIAFSAEVAPEFGYGCAVFMQSDIVDFQRQGWQPEEILAGLAMVLPKNIWLYVSQIPNLAKLGSTFVLQGGTQHNLAAVKAQTDFIRSRFSSKGLEPRIIVHEHTGEAGAIGAAVEAARLHGGGLETSFIGLDAVARIRYTSTRNEDTRCYFCKNKCLRTFIDVETSEPAQAHSDSFEYKSGPEAVRAARFETAEEQKRDAVSKVPLAAGANRLIIATCEKGTVEDVNDMRVIAKGLSETRKQFPNLLEVAAHDAWIRYEAPPAAIVPGRLFGERRKRAHEETRARRAALRIGVPRVLNMYSFMPFFSAYFESIGIPHPNLVFSDFTTEELYKEGSKRGSIDPCFPSKVALSHLHNLIYRKHAKTPLNWVFFPIIDELPTDLFGTVASKACPTASGTSESAKAAFIKEEDLFAKHGIRYVNPFLSLRDPALLANQLYREFGEMLELREDENAEAVRHGLEALARFNSGLQTQARGILDTLEAENRLGIVVLARPYHNDPGINHEILDEFQKLGYPVFSQDSLPTDPATLERVFGADVRAGRVRHPMDIDDVWKNSYSENTSRKVWAAKFVARHPNLVALELSSFKCGHDAPIYTLVQEIVECSGTPYFAFKDIDENKPTGSIKIRVETIGYFLKRYREMMVDEARRRRTVDERMNDYESRLRAVLDSAEHSRYALSMGDTAHHEMVQLRLPEEVSA
ncbi:MAG: CoA activase [Ignavibacteriae bacterium]|nr:CoA activase [Ignavibacteriota bacterium]